MKLIDIIMLYVPIGLGCYMAALVGTTGKSIAFGFLKTFIIYLVASIVFFLLLMSFSEHIPFG